MFRNVLMCAIVFMLATGPGILANAEESSSEVRRLEIGGYEMAYVERGSGVPVVFVHGTVSDYRWWGAQMEPFGVQFRTIAVSLRHFYPERWNGEGEDVSVRQHANDLAAFISGLDAGPVHVVGHSCGGAIVLLMASAHPELLRSVVLMDPSPLVSMLPRTPEADSEMEKRQAFIDAAMERLQQGDRDGGLERFIDGVSGAGAWQKMPDSIKQMILDNAWTIRSLPTDAREPFTCADAGRITVPVLLVTGEKSPSAYGVMMAALQPCLKEQEKATIPNAAHGMNRANPMAYNAAVLEFLARH